MNEMTPEQKAERDAKIMSWLQTSQLLAATKERENNLRNEIVRNYFPAAKKGTNTLELGQDYALKAVLKDNISVQKDEGKAGAVNTVLVIDYSELCDALAKLPSGVADGLIKWKPELSESKYKQLTEEERNIINKVLVIKPGTPALELKVPKSQG